MTDRRVLQCAGKDAFLTMNVANLVVESMRRSKRGRGQPFEAYRCPYCDFWHIGSMAPKRIRNQRRRLSRAKSS